MLTATTPGFFALVVVSFMLLLAYSLYRRFLPLSKARREDLFNRWCERVKSLFVYVFFQKRMMRDPYAGIYHILIFWGFMVLGYRSLGLVMEGLGVEIPFASHPLYVFMKDSWEILVLAGIVLAVLRRLFFRPERLKNSLDAWITLGMIATLMVTDLITDGSQILFSNPEWASCAPFSAMVAGYIPVEHVGEWYRWSWWIHTLTLFIFANQLPYSKHFHVYTSFFNVFFRKLDASGKLETMDLENIDENTVFGVDTYRELTWKQILDLYTCTECGRCRELCPTRLTDKPLSPMEFSVDLRNHVYDVTGNLLVKESSGDLTEEPALIGMTISEDVIWACTTCRWCEYACPLFISYTDKIVGMRQNLVLEKSEFPSELQNTFKGMEVNGNPWNMPADTRSDWCQDLDIPLISEKPDAEYLFWVGCAGSFDDHGQRVSKSLVKLLKAADVSFAILGSEETCTGDSARRLGNEYLFQMLAQQNIEKLNNYGVKKIVTNCPHCLNTLLHEYPDLGGHYEVIHSSQLVADLISRGRLHFKKAIEEEFTYHDPCYLGRTNGVYEDPRYIMKHIPGVSVTEMEHSREKGICCGAGGGRMWLEENLGTRINHMRLEDVEKTGAKNVLVACPFCYSMLDDASKEKEKDLTTRDVVELAAQALE